MQRLTLRVAASPTTQSSLPLSALGALHTVRERSSVAAVARQLACRQKGSKAATAKRERERREPLNHLALPPEGSSLSLSRCLPSPTTATRYGGVEGAVEGGWGSGLAGSYVAALLPPCPRASWRPEAVGGWATVIMASA